LGNVRVRLVHKDAAGPEPMPLKGADGGFLKWEGSMDVLGRGSIDLSTPVEGRVCKVHIQVAGGLGDSVFVLMEDEFCELSLVPSPAFSFIELSTYPILVTPGESFNIMGRVVLKYNGGSMGVPDIKVTASGPQLAQGMASSDKDGYFKINMNAPTKVGGVLSFDLGVDDPAKGIDLQGSMTCDVRFDAQQKESDLSNQFLYVAIVAILGLSMIAGVAVSIIRNDRG
jgi:hypothetical protein